MNLYALASFLIDRARVVPASWRLPLRYRSMVCSRGVEPELLHLFDCCRQFRCALDVGANHGVYAYKMAQRFQQVFAFEPNPILDADIRHYRKNNLSLLSFGLSDRNEETTLHIPSFNGIICSGWASVELRKLPFDATWKTATISLQRLDDQPFVAHWPIDLIKIDVEGHEYNVLLGGAQTIRRHKPVLILENNPQMNQAIHALLHDWSYRRLRLADLLHRDMDSPNILYLPVNR